MWNKSAYLLIVLAIGLISAPTPALAQTTLKEVTQSCRPYVTCGWNNLPIEAFEMTLLRDSEGANPVFKIDSKNNFSAYYNGKSVTNTKVAEQPFNINSSVRVVPQNTFNIRVLVNKPTKLTYLVPSTVDAPNNTTAKTVATKTAVTQSENSRSLPSTGGETSWFGQIISFLFFRISE